MLLNSPLLRRLLLPATATLVLLAAISHAQDEGDGPLDGPGRAAPAAFARPVVPAGYFLFPIAPGTANYLAGSMGELRPNHFHGGLDIKTGGGVNKPVYASADGYVSRLKQSSYGYGNVLYITHPNGLTTVYGHLNDFKGPVGRRVVVSSLPSSWARVAKDSSSKPPAARGSRPRSKWVFNKIIA